MTPQSRAAVALFLAAALAAACAAPRGRPAATVAVRPAAVRPGLEVLLSDSLHLLQGRRAGLITNHTALTRDGRHAIDVLHGAPGVRLVALFAPEHGIRGRAKPGERVEAGRDEATGLPVHSLYGDTREPTPAMLEGLDVLVFDIQEVGARYYTYRWTMTLAMAAAARAGIPFVVLDRPNPIGGVHVQGNVLDPAFATFVGLHPIPMRDGLTIGELARLANEAFGIGAELHVVPMDGWRRSMWFDDTGLRWTPPSPNMPDLESATHYPGTCLFEGTNLSVGRGTPRAFQWVGAPWLDGAALAASLTARSLPGVRFEPATFVPIEPGDGKFPGDTVRGVRFVVTDRATYDPTTAVVAALLEARRLAGDRWAWNASHFDRLAGTGRLRAAIDAGEPLEAIVGPWAAERARFEPLRARALLYD